MVGSVTGHEVHTAGSAVAGPTVTNSATPAAAAAARRRVPAPIRRLASRNRVLTRDLKTRRRWGRTAPKFAEQVWIDPAACTSYIYGIPRSASGQVRDGAWDLEPIELTNSPNIKASRQHWIDGVAWDQTALFEYFDEIIARKGAADGFTSREQLDERYATLDTIFEQVKADGRLKTRSELAPGTFRESGGIFMHFTRTGTPVFGGGGHHRLAIAQVLALPQIPVQVGLVHAEAIRTWRDGLHRPDGR